jgi:hypothetical protein
MADPTARELGLLGLLTGDPVLGNVGKALYEEGTKAPALAKHVGQGFFQDPSTGEITQNPNMAQWYEDARLHEIQQRQALETMLLGLPTRKEAGQAAQLDRLAAQGSDLATEAQGLPGSRNQIIDWGIDTLRQGGLNALANIGEEWAYSDAEGVHRAKAARWESELSKIAAGLNVTGFEMTDRQKWSPFAPGLSADEAARRWQVLSGTLGQEAAAMRRQPAPRNETPTYAPSQNTEVKRIGGKEYVKGPDGQWYER